MKNRLFSILVSLVFLPIAVLAQYIGFYFGKILYFIYENIMFLNMPQFLINIAPLVISGFLAGYVAAKVVQLIYKNYNVNFCLILPAIVIMISLLGTILNPIDLSRTLILLKLDISALLGYTGAVFKQFFGTSLGLIISFVMLMIWVILPVLRINFKSRKKDF